MTWADSSCDVVIVGGGIGGLTAAFEMSRRGRRVILLEKEEQLGGLAGCLQVEGEWVEKYYHHFFRSDQFIFELIRKLGGTTQFLSKEVKTGIYLSGRCYPFSRPMDLLRFRPLSCRERIQFGLNTLRARGIRDWRVLETVTAHEWLQSTYGPTAYRLIWEPLLIGKFGSRYREVSAVWFWNKIILRGGSRNARGSEELLYYPGSLQRVLDLLRLRIESQNGVILCQSEVVAIERENDSFRVVTPAGRVFARSAILTTPLPITADIMKSLPCDEYLRQIRSIRYQGNVCVLLVLDRPLSDIYWMNINEESLPFVGLIEHTNFLSPSLYRDRHLVYLTRYLDRHSDLYNASKPDVLETAVRTLTALFPAFHRCQIQDVHVFRSPFSQHVADCNYSRKIPPCNGSVPGLFVASMAQIYPEDRGANYAVRQGLDVSNRVDAYLRCQA